MTSMDFGSPPATKPSGMERARSVCSPSEYCPPAPIPPDSRLRLATLLLTLARNPLECWAAECFRQPIVRVRIPFCPAFLIHDPVAIKRILVDNAGNYIKDPIQKRIL